MKIKTAVVAIYVDADFYPPTINAIINLAEICEEVIVISRNNSKTDFLYPSNVRIKKIGKYSTVREMQKQNMLLKFLYFIKFTSVFFFNVQKHKSEMVVIYDAFALFAFYLVKYIRRNKIIWYHNHDMPDKAFGNLYSISGLATIYEEKAMKFINVFSLPSKERLSSYNGISNSVQVFIIPNYPSLKIYRKIEKKANNRNIVRVIYQGFIGNGHALEEFIELLAEDINGHSLELILKGSVTNEYKKEVNILAKKFNVTDKLKWIGIGPFNELPMLTSTCDIGIGINDNKDIISQNLGTASNKVYQYAASSMPVILSDSPNFRKYLNKYDWAFFTDGSFNSLKENLILIVKDLKYLQLKAYEDFDHELNFEKVFTPVITKIIDGKSS